MLANPCMSLRAVSMCYKGGMTPSEFDCEHGVSMVVMKSMLEVNLALLDQHNDSANPTMESEVY